MAYVLQIEYGKYLLQRVYGLTLLIFYDYARWANGVKRWWSSYLSDISSSAYLK